MAEPQQRPDEGSRSAPAAKKAPAKKAPAKKAPAKKAAAEKAPAKKAPAKKAPAKKAPAKKTPPPQPAPKATTNGAREAAATAKSSVQDAVVSPQDSFGRGHRIPLSLGLAAAGLVAIVVSRLRRG